MGIAVLISGSAIAGPYTDATNINRICTDTGREIGESALTTHAEIRKRGPEPKEEEIPQLKAVLAKSKAEADGLASVHQSQLSALEKIQKIREDFKVKLRLLYLKHMDELYGRPWRPIASEVWRQVARVSSDDDARNLGYAVCMDHFLAPGRRK